MTCLATSKLRPDAERVRRDLKTLALFIQIYCDGHHAESERAAVELPHFDVAEIAGKSPVLCPDCTKLLHHAFVKRSHCPMSPKPMCKHCPRQCYAPAYRQQIQDVMKYAGRRLVTRGRLDYLLHLLF